MTLDKVIMQRLAFDKYLYKSAVEQSQKAEPFCASSILAFHDPIELFLQISLEHLNVTTKEEPSFMGYWDLLNGGITGKGLKGELTQRESMRRLNRARVALKHHGTLPSRLDIEAFRSTATNFLSENTTTIFGIDFSSISLIEIVQNQKAREDLRQAEEKAREGDIRGALSQIAIAFRKLIDDYEHEGRDKFGRSPFFFGESMSFLDGSSVVGSGFGALSKLHDFVDHTAKSVKALQDALKILSLGIDYRRYARFQLLTPHVTPIPGGPYYTDDRMEGSMNQPTQDDVQFCIDFVIESAVTLQEFPYGVHHSKTTQY